MKSTQEWSSEFDLHWQNITSNRAPGIESYEKSVYLTRAQDTVLLMIYNGTLGSAFESTEAVTKYLASLVKKAKLAALSGAEAEAMQAVNPAILEKLQSKFYALDNNVLLVTLEWCILSGIPGCVGTRAASVVPTTQDELVRTARNPFKGPNENRVLRLSLGNGTGNTEKDRLRFNEILSKYPIQDYFIQYIEKPKPIILEVDNTGPGIDGYGNAENPIDAPMTCELDESLHQFILEEALRMAKADWMK